MEENNFNQNSESDSQIRAFFEIFLTRKKWFILSVFVGFLLTYIYLRYAIPQYKATTTILVKDENRGGIMSELASFVDLNKATGVKNNIDNEIEILRSRALVERTVSKLNLNISLIEKGKIINSDIYKNRPIEINYLQNNLGIHKPVELSLIFSPSDRKTFELLADEKTHDLKKVFKSNRRVFRYGELIETNYGDIIINKTSEYDRFFKESDYPVVLKINTLNEAVDDYLSRLTVRLYNPKSSVVELALVDPVKERAEDFLNTLFYIYNEKAIEQKNFVFKNTSKFIDNRLLIITEELGRVEQDVENFKRSNKLTNIDSEAELFLQGTSDYSKKIVELDIQLNVVVSMLEYMKKGNNSDLLPTNIIQSSSEASKLIDSYNQLILDRNRIAKSASGTNPFLIKMNQQINSLRLNVVSSLDRLKSTILIQKNKLNGKEGSLMSKIARIPTQERQFRVIARQQKVKEELYLFLLQKREETAISLATKEPNGNVIDIARASKYPISPNKALSYMVALVLGLLIPFTIIYVLNLLDTKVKSSADILGKVKVPFLGNIPKSSSTEGKLISATSRSSTDEALRIVRTNIDFVVSDVDSNFAKTIFSTSTVPGEGKTFISSNLALSFAQLGKKVLLIGMDIRKPKLYEYFTIPNKDKGVTNYLSTPDADVHDYLIKQDGYDCFYVFPSGVVPPNPADLLSKDKVNTMFEILKKEFDYIIVDTAPVGLVADTLLVANHADAVIYVVKANQLDKSMLKLPEKLYLEKKLPNMAIVLNYTEKGNAYGYGYGYGYGEDTIVKRSILKKIFDFIFSKQGF